MRSDMAKVIVERPRQGHEDSYKPLRAARKHDLSEDAPKGESMTQPHRRHYSGKQLNENLSPLKRFIDKQVGRPWDKVYSEVNEHIKVSNAVQAHIREHLDGFIYFDAYRDALGQIWAPGYSGPRLMDKGNLFVEADGIIKRLKNQPKIKYNKGWKIYVIYRARTHSRAKRDVLSLSSAWYYDLEYRLVEYKDMAAMGVTTDRVSSYFYAASHTDAVKKVAQENEYNRQYHWFSREYVPRKEGSKPKSKVL
jgi:hypothetical protein